MEENDEYPWKQEERNITRFDSYHGPNKKDSYREKQTDLEFSLRGSKRNTKLSNIRRPKQTSSYPQYVQSQVCFIYLLFIGLIRSSNLLIENICPTNNCCIKITVAYYCTRYRC